MQLCIIHMEFVDIEAFMKGMNAHMDVDVQVRASACSQDLQRFQCVLYFRPCCCLGQEWTLQHVGHNVHLVMPELPEFRVSKIKSPLCTPATCNTHSMHGPDSVPVIHAGGVSSEGPPLWTALPIRPWSSATHILPAAIFLLPAPGLPILPVAAVCVVLAIPVYLHI